MEKKCSVKNYFQSLNKTQKIAFVVVSFLIVAFLFTCLLLIIGEVGAAININYAKSREFIGSEYYPQKADDGYWTFTLNDGDSEFKVMQLSDLHFGGGCFSISKDRKAIDSIYSLVKYNKPDFITVTGDLSFAFCSFSGTKNNALGEKMAIAVFDAIGIPYAIVMGNHESEQLMFYSREKIGEIWSQGKYSLFEDQSGGGEDVSGVGNYVVKVKNNDGSMHSAYIFMDTHDYTENNRLLDMKNDGLHQDQIEWYKKEVDKLSGAKSFLFIHIPIPEYVEAWDKAQNNDPESKYYLGYKGEQQYPSDVDYGAFDAILEKGSTIGVFCGHDHLNNYSVEYKGVRLTYGLTIDFLAYPGIINSNFQRGCTLLTSRGGDDFTISQCVLAGITGFKKYKL